MKSRSFALVVALAATHQHITRLKAAAAMQCLGTVDTANWHTIRANLARLFTKGIHISQLLPCYIENRGFLSIVVKFQYDVAFVVMLSACREK